MLYFIRFEENIFYKSVFVNFECYYLTFQIHIHQLKNSFSMYKIFLSIKLRLDGTF